MYAKLFNLIDKNVLDRQMNGTRGIQYGHWSMTIELVKLNNQVSLYIVYLYKICPHLVTLSSGEYFSSFNFLIHIEEIHFNKSLVTFHISCYYVCTLLVIKLFLIQVILLIAHVPITWKGKTLSWKLHDKGPKLLSCHALWGY